MSILFEPFDLGRLHIKNRYAVCPMGTIHGADGGVNGAQKAYIVERAKGGFGLIYPSAHTVSMKYELPSFSGNFLCTDSHQIALKGLVDEVHKYGALFAVQLTPGYDRVNVGFPFECKGISGVTTHVSASDNSVFYHPDYKCKPLSIDEIHELVDCMGKAAVRAKAAGVDVVEIHAYGGYLIDQFMSKIWNRRTDEYGGSFENRMRFFFECYNAVREAVGPDFPLSVKFTPQHEIPGGRTLEDEGLKIAKMLDEMDIEYIHLDDGCYERWNKAIPGAYDKAGGCVEIAKKLREAGIKKPFMIQDKMVDPNMAEAAVKNGFAAIVGLGKQSIADPHYPEKLERGAIVDINFCTACLECLNKADGADSCAVNPYYKHELEYKLEPTKNPRKILIIGGGPGGMYTAKIAAEVGHKVELWEKSTTLGGNVNAAGGPDFKIDMRRFNENLQKQVYKAGVSVHLMKEADKDSVAALEPDVVIVAAGSVPFTPPIPGADRDCVVNAVDVLTGKCGTGDNVVVIGGGEVGFEAALDLTRKGKTVILLEMQDQILTGSMAMNQRMSLLDMIKEHNISYKVSTSVTEIGDGFLTASDAEGSKNYPCDTVVMATGFRSSSALADELKAAGLNVFTIGDYNSPRKVIFATNEGFKIIRELA